MKKTILGLLSLVVLLGAGSYAYARGDDGGECPPPEKPSVTLAADPESIDEGENSLLYVEGTNIGDRVCSIEGLFLEDGKVTVTPLTTTEYTVKCTCPEKDDSQSISSKVKKDRCDSDVPVEDTVTVEVTPKPTDPQPPVCAEGEVLNEEETECVTPDPTPEPTPTRNGGGGKCLNCDDKKNPVVEEEDVEVEEEEEMDDEEEVVPTPTEPSCPAMLKGFVKLGDQNSLTDVLILQNFLNNHMNAGVSLTGIYNIPTFNAVKAFQAKYYASVIAPWHTYLPGMNSTGYVYQTTRYQINKILCPEKAGLFPTLIP